MMVKVIVALAFVGCCAQVGASTLRHQHLPSQLFSECTNIGMQCAAANSTCALVSQPQRVKRDVASLLGGRDHIYNVMEQYKKKDTEEMKPYEQPEKMEMKPYEEPEKSEMKPYEQPENEAKSYEPANDKNTYLPKESGAYEKAQDYYNQKDKWLPTVYLKGKDTESSENKWESSQSNKWKTYNYNEKLDEHQKTIQKNTNTKTVTTYYKPKQTTYVQKNYKKTVVHHTYPTVVNKKITQYQKVVQPETETKVINKYDKSEKWMTAPVKYQDQSETKQLETVWKPVVDKGTMTENPYKNENYNKYENNKYYVKSSGQGASERALPPVSIRLERVRRQAPSEMVFKAMCVCAETFVPSADGTGCVCPHGRTMQLDGFCA